MRSILLTATLALLLTPALAVADEGDVAAGETVFKRCAACHAVGEGAKNKAGPMLNDVFGRQAGTAEGFRYSKAMVDAGAEGLVWTPETIEDFLHKPRDFVKGTKMSFAGLTKESDIENLTAYLLTFSPDFEHEEDND